MIEKFEGEYAFLSNFYEVPIFYKRRLYMTAEHLFQCCKTPNPDEREAIRSAPTPGQAKRLGRKVTLRPDWDQIKLKAMLGVLKLKFEQNTHLMYKLKATGTQTLIEGNDWGDTYWGLCNGRGENNLGRLLMIVRGNPQIDENQKSKVKVPHQTHDPTPEAVA